MSKKNALALMQNRCKTGANSDAKAPGKYEGEYVEYYPIEEENEDETQDAPALLPAIAETAVAVTVAVLKVVTLGALWATDVVEQQRHLRQRRQRWRALSDDAAADNYGRGRGRDNDTTTVARCDNADNGCDNAGHGGNKRVVVIQQVILKR